jgi:hypothetical protein
MSPVRFTAFVVLVCAAGRSSAFDVEAVVKSVDSTQRRLVVVAGQQERTLTVPVDVRVLDAAGVPIVEGLGSQQIREGAKVALEVERASGRPVLKSIRLVSGAQPDRPAPPTSEAPAKQDTSALVPLVDLGKREYLGFAGGLYPNGKNTRPDAHEAAGVALAQAIQPLDAHGQRNSDGKIVLLGIGFSNTVQAFDGFMQVARDDNDLNPQLVLVNGAVGGMSAQKIQNPDDQGTGTRYWATVDERLETAGVTREQVQAIWIKETDPAPHAAGFPAYVATLEEELTKIVHILPARFPNAKLVYFSSRTYGGWAKGRPDGRGPGNSEPFSYESGFAYKWLIEKQINGDATLNFDPTKGSIQSPWLSWSAYLWTNGSEPRDADGVFFSYDDFRENDRMHESPAGQIKVGKLLLQFFKTDTTTRPWFVRS